MRTFFCTYITLKQDKIKKAVLVSISLRQSRKGKLIMNVSIIMKIACWVGYCLFAGYSAYMTAKSVAMSFEMTQVWIVFIFVFIVALIAGYCLSVVIGEMQNRFNPSKSKFALGLIGFILFWGVSLSVLVLFALIVCVDSSLQNKSLKIGLLSVAASFIQLTGYGTGFLRAWWKRCVCGKSEFAAFEKNFYQ